MRFLSAILGLLLSSVLCLPTYSQTLSPSPFQQQAEVAFAAGKTIKSVTYSGTAEWFAGSQRESGTAELHANLDGSTSVQLNLGQASKTETQTSLDASRSCQWIGNDGTSHDILGPNCFIAIPWFCPSLFTQPTAQLPPLVGIIDEGDVSRNASNSHQISYFINLEGTDNSSTSKLIERSKVKVLYDPQTYLPASLEYAIHPDTDNSINLDVKVLFSDYRSVSGVMLPYHIERYVQRTLQLKLDISNASIE